jgi:MGT family glycosyltransferase
VRIVFSTWGSLGDLHPFLALAVELKRRGHEPVVATLAAWADHVRGAGVEFVEAGPDIPEDEEEAREMVRRLLDEREGPRYLFTHVLGPRTRESYDQLLAAVQDRGGTAMLVSHQIPLTAPLVAGVSGVPWVSCLLHPMAFLSAYDPPTPPQAPRLRPIAAVHPLVARALFAIARRATRAWGAPARELRASLGLPPAGNPVFEGQHSPARVLALFSRLLARKQPDYPPQTQITGFPFYDAADQKPAPSELLAFLDAGAPPILFTLGSSAVWVAGEFYRTSIEAARTLGSRALLLAGKDAAALRASGLPEGVAAFDYAPHGLVMPRASVIVHQGGVGTTGQALRSGRPMLVVPYGQDQPDNARRCVSLGLARTIPRTKYTAGRVVSALRDLLNRPSYAARAADAAAVVANESGTATACDAIEAVMRAALSPVPEGPRSPRDVDRGSSRSRGRGARSPDSDRRGREAPG